MENMHYYLILLLAIIAGCYVIKKVASCLVKAVAFLVLVAFLVFAYFFILR
jgi:hypothetical protein